MSTRKSAESFGVFDRIVDNSLTNYVVVVASEVAVF